MFVYYFALALTLGLAYPLLFHRPTQAKKIAYLAVIFAYLWFIATVRVNIGNDYHDYIRIFEEIRGFSGFTAIFQYEYEIGFTLLSKLMTFFVSDSVVMYGVYSLLILAPMGWFIYKYSPNPMLSVWLYLTLTFFLNVLNFVRQSLAVSVLVLGFHFLRQKKIPHFLVLVLVAATFHKTALVMLPMVLLCWIPFNWKLTAAYAGGVLIAYLFSREILGVVTQYIYTYYQGLAYLEQGLDYAFVMIPMLVCLACILLLPAWKKKSPIEANILTNFMLYNAFIWLFITRHFILERFSMFVYVFVLVALPGALDCLKSSQEDREQVAQWREKGIAADGTKAQKRQLAELQTRVKQNEQIYWGAITIVLLLTFLYHQWGAAQNFHGVYPYQSFLEWLP